MPPLYSESIDAFIFWKKIPMMQASSQGMKMEALLLIPPPAGD
jgi:hypothetical protein